MMECIQLPFLLPGPSQLIDGSVLPSICQPQVSCQLRSSGPELCHAWRDPGQKEGDQPMERFWDVGPLEEILQQLKICLSHRIDMNLML